MKGSGSQETEVAVQRAGHFSTLEESTLFCAITACIQEIFGQTHGGNMDYRAGNTASGRGIPELKTAFTSTV